MEEDCFICLWNKTTYFFNDKEYSKPLKNTKMYKLYKYTGYNHVINPNSFNPCYVCDDCLINNVYCCDIETKYNLIKEIKKYLASLKIIEKYNIPNEIFKKIIKYL